MMGKISRLIEPAMLLLLHVEGPSHGYELAAKASTLGLTDSEIDPSGVYRCLQQLESEGYVRSVWDTSGRGPARRSYELTDSGIDLLDAWVTIIEKRAHAMDDFVQKYRQHEEITAKGMEG